MTVEGKLDSEDLISTAQALADAARPVTLRHFRNPELAADNKLEEGFDPVTIADRECERIMRAILAERRPEDGILGEEFAPIAGNSGLTWVLDPIDGTRGFICGTPTWGVLVALNAGGDPLFGLIDQPYIGERFEGGFGIARVRGPQGETPLKTRQNESLSNAIMLSTFPEIGTPDEYEGFRRIARQTRLVRYGMDCYGYALLAAGQVDLVVEAGLKPYDVHAPIAVIEAAGGVITNWRGDSARAGGQVLAAGSARLHEKALDILAPFAN